MTLLLASAVHKFPPDPTGSYQIHARYNFGLRKAGSLKRRELSQSGMDSAAGRCQIGMTDTVLRPKPVITGNLLIKRFDPAAQFEDEGTVEAVIGNQGLFPTIIETRLKITNLREVRPRPAARIPA